jgi:acetolactate synthase-1/2/3 large subunit
VLLSADSKTVMSGTQLLIKALLEENVEAIFGQTRESVLPIFDVLNDFAEIKTVHVKHEQAAVHAADGYARVTGQPGVALVSAGPGAANALTGIATAYMDSAPLVVIAGQVERRLLGNDSFQEIDINGMMFPVSKHNYLVSEVRDLPRIIKEAFFLAGTGRPGPVVITIPKDIMEASTNIVDTRPVLVSGYQANYKVSQKSIRHFSDKVSKASKPVLLIGGGVISSGASHLLTTFAENAQIPIVSTLMGLGACPSDHPLHLGMAGMHGTIAANKTIFNADLLIILGVRFSDRVTGNINAFSPNSKKIHVEIDPAEINKNIKIDLPVTGDIGEVLKELIKANTCRNTEAWIKQISTWQKKSPQFDKSSSLLKPQEVIQLIDEMTDGDAIVTTDVGQHQIWTAHNYSFKHPRSFLTSGGLGTMGYGFPAAIGAAVAARDRQVICISGDGSFQMNLQELITAAQYKLPIKIAIMNNGYLGMVRQWQQLFYDRRYSHVKISSPNYATLAQAYGITGFKANNLIEAKEVISEALHQPGPALMEFNVKEEENVYPIVPPGQSNQTAMVEEAQEQFIK